MVVFLVLLDGPNFGFPRLDFTIIVVFKLSHLNFGFCLDGFHFIHGVIGIFCFAFVFVFVFFLKKNGQ